MKSIIKEINIRSIIAVVIIGLTLSVSSCKKFTDLVPNNSFAEETAFTTADRVAQAVNGVYSAAQAGAYTDGTNRGYPFGAANTEQQDARGEDVIAVPSFYLITYETTNATNSPNGTAMWETLYALINRANVVIEGVQGALAKGVISADLAKQYEGEARFLRALAHHELLIHYARPYGHTSDATHPGVPYRTTPVNTPERVAQNISQGRNTVKECYDKIIEDLTYSENSLPPTYSSANLKITHATRGAAIALKTRVYLHMNNWAKVIEEGNKIVPLTAPFKSSIGSYELAGSPDAPFAQNYGTNESVFSIENNTNRNSGTNGSISTMYSKTPGRGLIAISPIVWNAAFWKPNDLRRSLLAASDGRAYFSNKYRDPATFTDANPIIRYSEVLLNLAEALARTNSLDLRALALLNAVRNRAVTTVADQYTIANFITTNSLIQAILDERRIEFLAEGHRWGDIHRLATDPVFATGGIPAKVSFANTTFASWNSSTPYAGARSVAAIPYADYRFVWPIPLSETTNNPTLKAQQNPTW
ncbi:RagB/SusD family nutrient uptake outer membrane protein [Pedobacter suwonensis]|uniref:RagB/SusD family nutrient uptake outer membrane protein n=1 Tax=Pedobacter suwonensis TaxID=332999 RepID=UPI003686D76C